MRGIAFIGGEGPPPDVCRFLAAEAALTAAADSGLTAAEAAGLRPDWIIGDMDSLDDLRRLERYPPERVIRYPPDKDYTDTELVFRLLRDRGCDEIWLAGGGGGRTDHLFAIYSLFERKHPPERWITGAEDIRLLETPGELSAETPPGSFVSVFPLGAGPWKAESSGLRWSLAGLPWERGYFGISNETAGDFFAIRALSGRFMVIRPLAASVPASRETP
ncbi:MAG: thiamine diphosphokinase [Treponema sp.]|jgi:thiamine pyrophosphokinase|nr:thiamine diphosphokinase [Treponema sp.]